MATATARTFVRRCSVGLSRQPRVLLLTKTARWRSENHQQQDTTIGQVLAAQTHEQAVDSVSVAMQEAGFEVREQDARGQVLDEDLQWAEVCVALGGDGTMLRAAQATPAGMLVVGVNTDPVRSVGKLCSVAIGQEDPAADAAALVARLGAGEVLTKLSPRLRVTVDDGGSSDSGSSFREPLSGSSVLRCINECYVGESEPARPIALEVSIDDGDGFGPWVQWRSSGLLVATRDGAGAWMRNASAVHEGQVTAVLEAAASLGLARPPPPPEEYESKDDWKDALAARRAEIEASAPAVAAAANAAIRRHDEPTSLQFLVRDSSPKGAGGRGQPRAPVHGLGRRLRVRPTGWSVIASVDGLPPRPLPPNCLLTFAIEPDKSQWLRTLQAD